jgi:NADH dehydrogenase
VSKFLRGVLAVSGAAVGARTVKRALEPRPRYAPWERPPYKDFPHRVLVVGGGFAGYTAAKTLCELTGRRDDVGVMVLSRENFFTFWPLVPGVISSDVEGINIAQPLRRALITLGASFRRGELETVDFERRLARADGKEFPYDYLVLALGGEPAFFGVPGVEEHALTMKGLADAERVRDRVIERFEEVSMADGEAPASKLAFVVVGGGATGVETAAELHTLMHEVLAPDYPNINVGRVRIVLLEAGPNVLQELDPVLRRAARTQLVARRIEVMTNAAVREVGADYGALGDGRKIAAENVVWTAGGRPSAKLRELDVPLSGRDGVLVDRYLRVEGRPGVWAIGDCAAIPDGRGGLIPPTAQAAVQEGRVAARNILRTLDGAEKELVPFEYRPLGQLVELGSRFAVNEVMGVRFSGLVAALFWRAVYLLKLESPQSRVQVAADRLLDLFFRPAVTQIRRR